MKKITMATFKSFLRRNQGQILVKFLSHFDPMTDGTEFSKENEFHEPVASRNVHFDHSHGINGVWTVGRGRDYFQRFDDGQHEGIECSNSCGNWIVAIRKGGAA